MGKAEVIHSVYAIFAQTILQVFENSPAFLFSFLFSPIKTFEFRSDNAMKGEGENRYLAVL
jgi:hypothetical protein